MIEIRRCRDTWVFCDGNCHNCGFTATSYSTSTIGTGTFNSTPRTARWIWSIDVRYSNCNYKLETTGLPSYCPNCGAKMEMR